MQKLLVTLHRWLGFPLGLLFLITFATGALTSIDELIQRYQIDQFQQHYVYTEQSVAQQAEAIDALLQHNHPARQLLLPSPHSPYYQLLGRGETWTYAIGDLSLSHHQERHEDGFFNTVLQLHRNYLLGRDGLFGVEGKYYAAWVALLSLALSLLGLWIWWPLRKSFKTRQLVPNGMARKHFYYSHMTSGVVVLAAIVLLSLTGASITYRKVAQALLGVDENQSTPELNLPMPANWSAWLNTAYGQLPAGSQLTQVLLPRPTGPAAGAPRGDRARGNESPGRGVPAERGGNKLGGDEPPRLTLRFVTANDWLGLAGSTVKIDPQKSLLVEARDFGQLGFGAKLLSILKPLHTGHHLPVLYTLVLLIFSLLGTVMVFSGLVSFISKKRKWLKLSHLKPSSNAAV